MFYTDYAFPPDRLKSYRQLLKESRPYLVFFTGRSGSTYLMDLLYHSGVAGQLKAEESEPFCAQASGFLELLKTRGVASDSLLEHVHWLIQNHRSTNGVVGFKVAYLQVIELLESGLFDLLFSTFPKIYLHRRNLLDQAVSYYLADKTNYWHTFTPLEQANPSRLSEVPYDGEGIYRWIATLYREELGLKSYFAETKTCPLEIEYGDLKQDPTGIVKQILGFLRVPVPENFQAHSKLQKVSSEKNQQLIQEFRTDRFLEQALALGLAEDRL